MIENFPVVLLGVEYWSPLIEFLQNSVSPNPAIDARDLDQFLVTDSPRDAASLIQEIATERFWA